MSAVRERLVQVLRGWLLLNLAVLPLTVAGETARLASGMSYTDFWIHGADLEAGRLALQAGGAVALLQAALVCVCRLEVDPLIAGFNLFLIVAGAAHFTGLGELLIALDAGNGDPFRPLAFACVVVAGIVATFHTAGGFVRVSGAPPAVVRRASVLLLALAAVATVVSFRFRDDALLGAAVPGVGLLVIRALLQGWARRAPVEATEPSMIAAAP